MSADYANATINAATTTGPPGSPAVQPPIGYNVLTAANTEAWSGHIGTELGSTVVAAYMNHLTAQGGYPALPGTLARDKAGALMTWATSVAGAAAAATGTLTGSAFVAGAGTAVSQGVIPAGGAGWVKN